MPGLFGGGEDYPAFNPLGLLLGGRGYASSYFGNRDQFEALRMKEARDRTDAETFANGVLASPELSGSIENPDDRMNQWRLWRRMNQDAPAPGRQLGSDVLTQSLGGIHQREAIARSGAEARATAEFNTDQAIQEYATKQALDQQVKDKLMEDFLAPDPLTGASGREKGEIQFRRNAAAAASGLKVKEGYNAQYDAASGEFYQTPSPGTPDYIEVQTQLQSFANLAGWGTDLMTMFDRGVDRETYQAVRNNMVSEVRQAEKLGTLDEGTTNYVNTLLPSWWGSGPNYSDYKAREELRVFTKKQMLKAQQLQAATRLPLVGPTTQSEIPPPPPEPPRAARENILPAPQPRQPGRATGGTGLRAPPPGYQPPAEAPLRGSGFRRGG